jgi:Aspartyl protease
MPDFKWFASLVLSAASALSAETRCPGNAASLSFRLANSHQMIVAVSVNHSGPYNFLLDTGTQITTVDPSLDAELHLEPQGRAVVAGVGTRQFASMAQLDLLEAGSQAVSNQKVLVYDLRNLHVQGILGEDFLGHFDMLIDNVHSLLCLDNSNAMRADLKGPHTALVTPEGVTDGVELPNLIILQARLSDASRPVRLMLDSGANGAVLFNTSGYLALPQRRYLQGTGVNGKQLIFSSLPPQDVKIGSLKLSRVPFVSIAGAQEDSRAKGFDGVLTLRLFRRVFIAHADHFAVLEPQ